MDAESSLIVDLGASTALADELADVLAAYEEATGLQVCFRPMSDQWRQADGLDVITGPFDGHRSSFCQLVKARSPAACLKCDYTDLPAVCSPPEGREAEPFVRTCHAGADELLLPLWSDGVLTAVLFLGQFTRAVDSPQRPIALRHVSGAEARHLRTLSVPLRSYLLDLLSRLDVHRHQHADGRRGAIDAYIRGTLSTGPTLRGLAHLLSLSRSRTSHVVRELTERSFQDLVEERRIAVARDLLAGTNGTIAWVARQTGFKDTAYFCRYFKRKSGTTPTSFRKKHSRTVTA